MGRTFAFWITFAAFIAWILLDGRASFDNSIRVTLIGIFFACCLQVIVTGLLWYASTFRDDRHFVIAEHWNREPQNGVTNNGKTT